MSDIDPGADLGAVWPDPGAAAQSTVEAAVWPHPGVVALQRLAAVWPDPGDSYWPDPGAAPHTLWSRDNYPYTVTRRRLRGYGWRPDRPDHRDRPYVPVLRDDERKSRDLSEQFTIPVYNQGPIASCTANAIAAAIAFARVRETLPHGDRVPSRLFIYFGERVIEGTTASDSGASLRDGIKVVAADGACFEDGAGAWPYVVDQVAVPPPRASFQAALKDRAVAYFRLRQKIAHMEDCIASGYPFVFGFSIFSALESPAVADTGVLPRPTRGEQPIGGHAVMAVGFSRERRAFKVLNSWGETWGDNGFFWMPYSYIADAGLADDFWTIRLVAPAASAGAR